MRKIFIYVLCIFCSGLTAQVYRGTIDKYPVVFEIMTEDYYDFNAQYFYTRVKKDIRLKRKDKNSLMFSDVDGEETFSLKKSGKSLNGTWTSGEKKLSVNLSEVDPGTLKAAKYNVDLDHSRTSDTYNFLKAENIQLIKSKEETWEQSTIIEWMKEPISQTEFPRIKSSPKIKNISALNELLAEEHFEEIVSYFSCQSTSPTGEGEYLFGCSIMFISDQFISIHNLASYYCGGAHPDFGAWGLTIDHQNIKKMHLSDLYWFGDKKKFNPNTSWNQDDNMDQFGEIWNELAKKHYPEEMQTKTGDNECNYNDPTVWSRYTWFLTPGGLLVGSYFARVMRSCDTDSGWPIIPYKDLEKYRVHKEKYKLE
jgi:hypothetical protein